ncbi:MAG: sulfurtransferase TusA family protein [Thermoplasmata archaeon]|nr:sulfurtransferase TusA family protein [Thermoplasmata archaeon]
MEVLGCSVPDDCRVDIENDTWTRVDAGGPSFSVGLLAVQTAFAGRYTSVRFRDIEGVIERGRSVATLESLRSTAPFRIPVTARVIARNEVLTTRPKLLNDSPYDRGWVVRILPTEPTDPERLLATPSSIRSALEARIRDQRIHCYPASPDLEMYEIGSECSATLAKLDEELLRQAPEQVVLLVTDDPTSPIELVRWSDRTGHSLLHHRLEGNLHHFLIRKEAAPVPRLRRAATGEVRSA